ncbi:MAG: hypothetical protein ACLQMF_01695 [Rectinemataceae bacterium]
MSFRQSLSTAIAVLLLLAWGGVAEAQDSASPPVQPHRILLPPPIVEGGEGSGPLAEPFASTLRTSFSSAAAALGFSVSEESAGGGERDPARIARGEGAAWYALCFVAVVNDRLSYGIEVFSAWTGELVAADSFSAYAGPTAFPLIDDSATGVAARLASYVDGGEDSPRRPVAYRVTVRSQDEGARITLGSPDSRLSILAGTIRDGKLVLPYYPFARGSTIRLYVSAPGRRTETVGVYLGQAAPTVYAPSLERQSVQDLLVGTGTGRLFGVGVGYRRYVAPEWSFLFLEDHLFAGYDFLPGSSPFLHEEIWTGFGSYLLLPPESRFRFGAGIGMGWLFSYSTVPEAQRRLYFDFALLPVYVFFDYSVARKAALWLSISAAYSLGTGSAGILGREWMGSGPPALSAGVLWRL